MSPATSKSTIRIVTASFIAGAGAMLFAGLVAPVAMQGGLSIREAWAATVTQEAPIIEPLDVAAINAQLADAERSMEGSRQATEVAMARLDRLAGR
jgi:hypothetical protein